MIKFTSAVAAACLTLGLLSMNSFADTTSSGTMTVTGTIQSSIALTVESSGGSTSGTGSGASTSGLGTIAKYGVSTPTGFSITRGASNWTLSSTVGIQVKKANITSSDYTLTAQLGSAPATGVVWKVNGSTVSDSATTNLTSTGTYASTASYSWDIVIADSATAAAIDNTATFAALAN